VERQSYVQEEAESDHFLIWLHNAHGVRLVKCDGVSRAFFPKKISNLDCFLKSEGTGLKIRYLEKKKSAAGT
jgi:hypothetical protein